MLSRFFVTYFISVLLQNSQVQRGRHMRTLGILCLITLAWLPNLFAKENPTSSNTPCVTPSETVYHPGVDGVKPPQPQSSKKHRTEPEVHDAVSLELLVNSEGQVCDARVLRAKDRVSAEKVANYVSENWIFTPATKQGKPVAVRFTVNFGPL